MHDPEADDTGWDLEERDRLLEEGVLTDEDCSDPTEVLVREDE